MSPKALSNSHQNAWLGISQSSVTQAEPLGGGPEAAGAHPLVWCCRVPCPADTVSSSMNGPGSKH